MSKNSGFKIKTFVKSIVFTDLAMQQVLEIMQTKNVMSFSQAVRDAIFEYHRKVNPPYLKPSVSEEGKIEAKKKEEVLRAVPDEVFLADNLQDCMIYTDEDQAKWVLFRKISNYVGAVQLDKIKDWVNSKDPEFMFHQQKASVESNPPYEKELEDPRIRQVLQEQYGVAITV